MRVKPAGRQACGGGAPRGRGLRGEQPSTDRPGARGAALRPRADPAVPTPRIYWPGAPVAARFPSASMGCRRPALTILGSIWPEPVLVPMPRVCLTIRNARIRALGARPLLEGARRARFAPVCRLARVGSRSLALGRPVGMRRDRFSRPTLRWRPPGATGTRGEEPDQSPETV